MAKQTHTPDPRPPGHVPLPVFLTGSMGLGLAFGLHWFGFLEILDLYLASLVTDDPSALTPTVSNGVLSSTTAVVAYGLALVILEIPGNWRRLVIWISSMAVIAGWVPVAAIAHAKAPIAAPLVAAAWAGLCAIIYAARHHMETDDVAPRVAEEEIATPNPPDGTD